MISSGARSTVNRPWKKSLAFTMRAALRLLEVDLRVEREHRRRVVGGRIGVGQAAAERAAIADLRIADLGRGLGDDGTALAQQRRASHVVVRRARADLDRAVLLADAREARDPARCR